VCQKGWPTSHKIAQQLLIAPSYPELFLLAEDACVELFHANITEKVLAF